MKRIPASFLVATVFSVFAAPQASANCTVKFTQIPDFVVPGMPLVDGTCKHQGDILGLTDLLEIEVVEGDGCDINDNNCTVQVTATWAGGRDQRTVTTADLRESNPHTV